MKAPICYHSSEEWQIKKRGFFGGGSNEWSYTTWTQTAQLGLTLDRLLNEENV